jgi:hypothetical protein
MADNARLIAPAAARNREPIANILRRHLPPSGLVLEIASGSGEHVVHFAITQSADLRFQPSDPDAGARASTDAWVELSGVTNVLPAIALDAAATAWPLPPADAVICINMIHIAPWDAAVGLVRGAAAILPVGGRLYLYGPFRRNGRHTATSNETFDRSLRYRDPSWGVRDLEDVVNLALLHGFSQPIVEEMPANNLSVIFTRLAPG